MKKIIIYFIITFSLNFSQNKKLDSLKIVLESEINDSVKISLMNNISSLLIDSDHIEAEKYADSAFRLAEKLDYTWGIIDAKRYYGNSLLLRGELEKALSYYYEVLKLSERVNDRKRLAEGYNFGGNLFYKLGKFDLAMENYLKAISINELLNNSNNLGCNYNGLGMISYKNSQMNKALNYYSKALDCFILNGNKNNEINVLLNIASIYGSQKKYELSIEYLKQVISIAKTINDKITYSMALNNLGSVYVLLGKDDLAIEYFEDALELKYELGNMSEVVLTLHNIGNLYHIKGEILKSIERLKKAEKIIADNKMWELAVHVYKKLSDNYRDLKKYEMAFKYSNLLREANDSLTLTKNRNRLAELETKFETEKLEQENKILKNTNEYNSLIIYYQYMIFIIILIALLILALYGLSLYKSRKKIIALNEKLLKNNEEISFQKSELDKLNSTKDKLFSIIAHDLKTPFTVFVGFTETFIQDYDEISKQELKRFIKDIHTGLKKTYSLLENLLYWARSQKGEMVIEKEIFSFSDTVNKLLLIHKTNAELKNIEINNLLDDDMMVFADKTTIKIVLSNLISNAIKFTSIGGIIEFSSTTQNGNYVIAVSDTGIGVSEDKISTLFNVSFNNSTFGTNNEKGTGIGLPLCKEFIEINDGRIWVESIEGEGSKFIFTIPRVN